MFSWPFEGRDGSRSVILVSAYRGDSRRARVVETVMAVGYGFVSDLSLEVLMAEHIRPKAPAPTIRIEEGGWEGVVEEVDIPHGQTR